MLFYMLKLTWNGMLINMEWQPNPLRQISSKEKYVIQQPVTVEVTAMSGVMSIELGGSDNEERFDFY